MGLGPRGWVSAKVSLASRADTASSNVPKVYRVLLSLVFAAMFLTSGSTDEANAAGIGAIAGAATDSLGAPLSGVIVRAAAMSDSVQATAASAADGTFTIADLPVGDYFLCFDAADATGGASSAGYVNTCWKDIDSTDGISLDQVTPVHVTGGGTTSGIVQQLPSAGGVSGIVTDAAGHPLAGAVVSAVSGPGSPPTVRRRGTTGADGQYVIPRLRPGTQYTICVSADSVGGGTSMTGYLDQCYGHVGAQDGQAPTGTAQKFTVVGGAFASLNPMELDAAGQVSGTLTDRGGGPIEGARVYAWGQGNYDFTATDVTDASGHFLLSVDNDGGAANGLYHGTRLPLAPLKILFTTGADSDFVNAYYQGAPSPYGIGLGTPTIVTPTPGEPTVLADVLDNGSSLGGTVTDVHGHPLANVQLWVQHEYTHITYAFTDASGAYRVDKLPEGSYDICFMADDATGGDAPAGYLNRCSGGTTQSNPTQIQLGYNQDRTDIDVELPAAAGISGRVTGPTWQGIPWAIVYFYDGAGSMRGYRTTGTDGTYRIQRLEPGTYTVCFDVSSLDWTGCYDDVPAGGTRTPIQTTGGVITTGIDAQVNPEPDTTAPNAAMTRPTNPFSTSRMIAPAVTTSDDGSGVEDFDVRYRYTDWDDSSFSAWVHPPAWQHHVGPLSELTGARGRNYCFSVRARDHAGNISAYSEETCTTIPLDDRALGVSAGHWHRVTRPHAFEKTESRSRVAGATLTIRRAYAGRIAVLVRTCPECGRLGVYVDSKLLRTFDTRSSQVHHRVLLVPRSFDSRRVTITLRRMHGPGLLAVDGIAVTRKATHPD